MDRRPDISLAQIMMKIQVVTINLTKQLLHFFPTCFFFFNVYRTSKVGKFLLKHLLFGLKE